MLLLRIVGVLYLLLSLYYARFFAARQEPTTLLQMATLWCASGVLLLATAPRLDRAAWFDGWRPVVWPAWVAVAAAAALAVLVFVVMDRDSHSASDTLNRIAPTYALVAALLLRLRYERARWSR